MKPQFLLVTKMGEFSYGEHFSNSFYDVTIVKFSDKKLQHMNDRLIEVEDIIISEEICS